MSNVFINRTFMSMLLAVALVAGIAPAQANGRNSAIGQVYAMDNDPTGNKVVVYNRLRNGKLRLRGRAKTGGLGAGDNAAADPLGGQNAMILSQNRRFLYVVNAGSNEISSFAISRSGWPVLQQVISSNGEFPVSLTTDGELVYVLNAGGDGSIAGFEIRHRGKLRAIPGSVRALGLGGTSVPVGDARNLAPGDIGFDTLNRRLLVAHAGGGANGELLSFLVEDDDAPSDSPAIIDSIGAVPFSLDFTENGTALIAEASGSVSSYNYIDDVDLGSVSGAVANGQAATCWVRTTSIGVAFTTNTLSGSITSYNVSRNGELTLEDASAATGINLPTDFDISRDDRFLYVVSSGGGGVRGFRVNRIYGSLTDLGLFPGLPTFDNDGFAPQGIVVR